MRAMWKRVLVGGVACATLLVASGPVDRASSQQPRKPTVTVYKSPT